MSAQIVFGRFAPEAHLVRIVEPVAVRGVPNDLLKYSEVECVTVKVAVLQDGERRECGRVEKAKQESPGVRADRYSLTAGAW